MSETPAKGPSRFSPASRKAKIDALAETVSEAGRVDDAPGVSLVDPAAEGAREGAKDEPSGEREEGGEDTDIQRLLAADDQAGEQVSATRVGAQGVARLRARDGVGLGADLVEEVADGRVVRGDPRSDQGKQDEGRGDDKADEEDGIAAQPAPGAGDEGHPGRLVWF